MTTQTSIGTDRRAFRKGVVLGLTMAEIMLLLIFCLLIAASVVFQREHKANQDLAARLAEKSEDLDRAIADRNGMARLAEAARRGTADAPAAGDDWRKLVEAQQAVARLGEAGLTVQRVTDQAQKLATVVPLLEQGATASQIRQALDQSHELRQSLEAADLRTASMADIARWAAIGKQAEADRGGGRGSHDWPPIVSLSEAKGYHFPVASAELTPDFEQKLKSKVVDEVASIVARYDVDVVEVIGHTDEQPMNAGGSNLDARLVPALSGKVPIDSLSPADNAGLGMARAVSVARVLKADPRLRGVTVLPMSGGQMILPGDTLTDGTSGGDVQARRRIEIRMRRSEGRIAP
ncbi:hypothetical protein [Labrys monachus]|uniref:Flagellar motor protein MotB n=1 Tax=Labrys monachus TaxID=217067 RepID=A0ABU0F984_9HYPH|nr:hypothetical protein [Labrys monachus]MDQ0390648.1 flagellar motor protein MotB [Labrys monachus]